MMNTNSNMGNQGYSNQNYANQNNGNSNSNYNANQNGRSGNGGNYNYGYNDYYGAQESGQVKRIMQEVYNRQNEGIDFHGQMADQFEFLNLKGFAQWQKELRKEEMENSGKTQKKFISRRRMLLDPPERRYQFDAMPQNWYGHTNMDLNSEDIPAHVRKSLNQCLQWEEETLELYKQKAKELSDMEAYDDYMEVKELMVNVLGEVECLKDLIMELESVRYDMKHIKKLQEKFKKEYKSTSIRRNMPIRTYKIEFEYEDED